MSAIESGVAVGMVVPANGKATEVTESPRGGAFRPGPDPRRYKGGRPKSGLALAERIRRRVDLDEIVDLAIDIARGRACLVEKRNKAGEYIVTGDWIIPKTSDRVTALNWLAERGFVKPPTTIAIEQGDAKPPIDFSRFTDEELDTYVKLYAKAAGETPVIDVE